MYTSYADFEEERKYAFRETKQWFQIPNQVSYESYDMTQIIWKNKIKFGSKILSKIKPNFVPDR